MVLEVINFNILESTLSYWSKLLHIFFKQIVKFSLLSTTIPRTFSSVTRNFWNWLIKTNSYKMGFICLKKPLFLVFFKDMSESSDYNIYIFFLPEKHALLLSAS